MDHTDPQQASSERQFSRQASQYGRSHILARTLDVEDAFAHVPQRTPPGTALDVATGGGHTALWLARAGYEVSLCDISRAMAEAAVRLLHEEGYTAQAAVHTAEALPYADASFDVVTCRVAAHHFSDKDAFTREAARILRPGGALVVIDGSVPDDEPEAAEWIHSVEKLRDPSHGRFDSPSTWQSRVRSAGLALTHCHLSPLQMPDLEWYFETAATPAENRDAVRRLIHEAPTPARTCFQIAETDEKITWWWPRITLVATKS